MNMAARKAPRIPRQVILFALVVAVALAFAHALPHAQAPAKKAMTIDDYTKWRSIERPVMSGDGKWVAYALQVTNVLPADAKPVLHLLNLGTNVEVTVADATEATFSPDSKWVAYQVTPGSDSRCSGQTQIIQFSILPTR